LIEFGPRGARSRGFVRGAQLNGRCPLAHRCRQPPLRRACGLVAGQDARERLRRLQRPRSRGGWPAVPPQRQVWLDRAPRRPRARWWDGFTDVGLADSEDRRQGRRARVHAERSRHRRARHPQGPAQPAPARTADRYSPVVLPPPQAPSLRPQASSRAIL
jgi:hypothetical protein